MKQKFPSQYSNIISAILAMLGVLIFFYAIRLDNFGYMGGTKSILLIAVVLSGLAASFSIKYLRLVEKKRKSKNIYVIYSTQDRKVVSDIVNNLKERGYNPWVDYNDLLPGQILSESIKSAILSSAVAIYIISNNSKNTPYVEKELEMAKNELHTRNKSFSPILPVKIDDSDIPTGLKSIKCVDIRR